MRDQLSSSNRNHFACPHPQTLSRDLSFLWAQWNPLLISEWDNLFSRGWAKIGFENMSSGWVKLKLKIIIVCVMCHAADLTSPFSSALLLKASRSASPMCAPCSSHSANNQGSVFCNFYQIFYGYFLDNLCKISPLPGTRAPWWLRPWSRPPSQTTHSALNIKR